MFDDIQITYYVNPNLFWFKYEANPSAAQKKQKTLENKIQHYRTSISEKSIFKPSIDELVIFRHCSGSVDKWVRARVDHELEFRTGSEYILWTVDYGFPIQSSSKWIRKLESFDLRNEKNETIFKGGLNAGPATLEFNFLTCKNELIKTRTWSEKATTAAEEFLFDAETIKFCPESAINEHLFGDVIVKLHSGTTKKLSDFLSELNECTHNFPQEHQSCINKPYWECQRQTKIFKIEENFKSHYNFENIHLRGECSMGVGAVSSELSRKMSDWNKRNTAYDLKCVLSKKMSFSAKHLAKTDHRINNVVQRPEDDCLVYLPCQLNSFTDKIKEISISNVPMSKRYDLVKPARQQTENQQSQSDKKPDRISLFEQKGKKPIIYPAGYIIQ